MTDDRYIQHPDITEAERTGYPARRMVSIPLTDKIIRNYLWEQRAEFIDFCMLRRDVVDEFLGEMQDDFEDWCKAGLEA